MRILIITETASIHAARWVNQLKDTGWDVHVFQAIIPGHIINSEFVFGKIYFPGISTKQNRKVFKNTVFVSGKMYDYCLKKQLLRKILYIIHNRYFLYIIKKLKPDVIHSHGLNINWNNLLLIVLRAKQKLKFDSPWLYSSWGSDLDYYAKMSPSHTTEVRSAISKCDYLTTECNRDLRLAREFGFKGEYLGFFPDYGGVSLQKFIEFRQPGPISDRKSIILKGRDNTDGGDPIGRALTAIKAFILCKDIIRNYKIVILQATSSVIKAASELRKIENLNINFLSYIDYVDLLKVIGSARIFIALTINDGLPSSLVEAMALGVFTIHSDLEPIREWINTGVNGMLVPPEDPAAVADAIRLSLIDDDLVNKSSSINYNIIKQRLSDDVILPRVLSMYNNAAKKKHIIN